MANYITTNTQVVGQTVMGSALTIEVIRVQGSSANAPKTYIQASIHGAEVQGNAIIYWLLEQFKQQQPLGDVILVPHCNPLAGNLKMGEYTFGRFDPIMGDNWNHLFYYQKNLAQKFVANLAKSLSIQDIHEQFRQYLIEQVNLQFQNPWGLSVGQQVTLNLQSLAHQADIVLDLHTGNCSTEHLYAPSYARSSAQYLQMRHHLLLGNVCANSLDEVCYCPWWDLAEELAKNGYPATEIPVEAYTLEWGNQELIDLASAKQQSEKVLNYLRYKGAVAGFAEPLQQYCVAHVSHYKTFFAPLGGLYEFAVAPGAVMKKGDLLATCLHQGQLIPIYIPESAVLILHFASAAIPKGAELGKFLINVEFHS